MIATNKRQPAPALVSPIFYLRELGYRIERSPEDWEMWSVRPPRGTAREDRPQCSLSAIVEIAVSEGWTLNGV